MNELHWYLDTFLPYYCLKYNLPKYQKKGHDVEEVVLRNIFKFLYYYYSHSLLYVTPMVIYLPREITTIKYLNERNMFD